MVAKLLSRALVVLAALPAVTHALGLGDIRLNSSLNAPLDAEITLDATPEELATLRAEVASRETFARYGLEWPAFLGSVTLRTTRGADGRDVIRVRSTEAITEPFVTFLIEVNWPRGRLVREYTMLLDPPVYTPVPTASTPPVAAPRAGDTPRQGAIERAPAQPAPASEPADTTPFVEPSAASADSYQVARGDTLSAIQRRLNPADAAAARQWMLAVYQSNPQAFDGNVNVLRAGSVLRIPDANAVAAVDPAAAGVEIRRQFTAWRGAAAATGAEPGRLRLVTPSEPGAGTGESGGRAEAELQGRITDLESQLAESRRLLEVRSAELADLQRRLADAAGGEAPPVEATPAPTEAPVADTATPDSEPVAEAPAGTTDDAPVAADPGAAAGVEEPAPAPVRRDVAAAEEGGSILDTILGLWWLLALALLAIVGFFALRAWRTRKANEFDDSIGRLAAAGADSLAREPTIAPSAMRQAPMAAGPREQAAFLVEESGARERPRFEEESRPAPVAARPVKTADETISSETAINLDQGDPLAEADFHMAYGLYDQAADLVSIAIAREPERRDLRLKLLEVFFVWGNKDQFLQAARALAESRAEAAPGEWEKIVIMGKQLAPDDAMFTGGAFSGAAAGGVDLDLAGGENRVDFDLLGEPVSGGQANDGIDLDIGGAFGESDATSNSTTLADTQEREGISSATTRQMTAKMQPRGDALGEFSADNESPTVEQPGLHSQDKTVRQKLETALKHQGVDQTAELNIDDLGLDLGSLDTMDNPALNATQETPTLVAGLDDRSRRIMEDADSADDTQQTPTGSWNIGDVDIGPSDATLPPSSVRALDGGAHVTNDPSRTTQLPTAGIDFDLGDVESDAPASSNGHGIDLDVGPASPPDTAFTATQKLPAEDLALPDLEPVTMSEVGTKLDLARAYMDMGDPEGARNILEEVLHEGSVAQKQEAQRLIESLPG